MGINIGNSKVKAISVGNNKIKSVYVGATKVWSAIRGIVAIAMTGKTGDYVNKVYISIDLESPFPVNLVNIQSERRISRVACNKKRFIVLTTTNDSSYSDMNYSDDGLTWTPSRLGWLTTESYPFNIKYFEGIDRFVLFYNQTFYMSQDGLSWSAKTTSNVSGSYITDVAYGDGNILVIQYLGYPYLYNFNDGTYTSINEQVRVNFTSSAYGNGKFIAYEARKGFCSLDIATKKWTLVSDILNTAPVGEVNMIFANGMFLVGTVFNDMYYSYDGVTWTAYAPPYRLVKLSYDGDKFLGTSDNNYGYSYNGITWTYVQVDNPRLLNGGIAGN